MPAFIRANFNFSDGRYGWNEHHYYVANVDLAVAAADAAKLAALRDKFLGIGAVMDYIKLSADDVFRDSLILKGPPVMQDGSHSKETGLNDAQSDMPFHAMLARHECGPAGQYRAMKYISGWADEALTNPPGIKFNADMRKLWEAYLAELTGGKWGAKVLLRDGAGAKKPCTDIVISDLGHYNITSPGHGLAVDDEVRLSGFRGDGSQAVNGLWRVATVVNANEFVVLGFQGVFAITKAGFVQKRVYQVVPYVSVKLLRSVSRKRGVGPSPVRGRRSKARK